MKHRLHPIPMAVQMARLKQAYPGSRASLKRDVLCWVADLTPTPLSRTYRVKLEMHKDGTPEVRLVHPTLQTRDGECCPHLYPGGVLCLYLPGAFEWTKEMQLVATVVPWISEWLAHYEVWLATGVWTGGGEHPEIKDDVNSRGSRRQHRPPPARTDRPTSDTEIPATSEVMVRPLAVADFLASKPISPSPTQEHA